MQRNLRIYPWFQAFASLHFWLPIFFLYFLTTLSIRQVLILEAIYYGSVVALETPSGYFSDRLGRKPTLLIAATAWTAAYVVFAATSSFGWFVVAQVFLAVGMSFQSGTDSSLLYDSLQAVGREKEIAEREGNAASFGFFASALAALVGGLLASYDLRIAYLLSAVGSVCAFVAVYYMKEPPRITAGREVGFVAQLLVSGRLLGGPVLLWTTLFAVAMTVFNHIPYEFFQPYLSLLLKQYRADEFLNYQSAPLATSVHGAFTMFIAGGSSRLAAPLAKWLGPDWALLATMVIQGLLILAMAVVLHPVVAILILLRSVPRAVMNPIIRSIVHPRVASNLRATVLSLQSLTGRLCFGAVLLATSLLTGDGELVAHEQLSDVLYIYAAIVLFTVIALAGWQLYTMTPIDSPDE